jgi:membrane associated rhomboid family serine protease
MPKTEPIPPLKMFAQILGGFVALIWLITLLDVVLFNHHLALWGILPKTLIGLRGILFSPFLHANIAHVAANTVPFVILGGLVLSRGVEEFFTVSAYIMVIGGLGTWLIAPMGHPHVGASGLIFGYFGYLIMRGWYDGRFVSGIITIVVFLLFGGMLWGIRPFQEAISWQGHLCGLCAGVVAASRWRERKQ